jgi:group I intron endonuclease
LNSNSLNNVLKRGKRKSAIYSAILKYGYSNFSLDILEYCTLNLLIKKEQYYIDNLNPEYNICKVAGSRLGIKWTEETRLKNSKTIRIEDLELKTEKFFIGNKKAANYLSVGISTLCRYKKSNKLLKNRYLIYNA